MHETSTDYLDLIDKNNCYFMFEKSAPAGRLKREMITLTTYDGRALTLSAQGFTACPVEVPRAIFDEFLAANLIEQEGREDSEGRIFFRLTPAGHTRADLARRVSEMTVTSYKDFE
jgi:hypothetical protein